MIQKLHIAPTFESPEILIEPATGILYIHGNSLMNKVEEFYRRIFLYLDEHKHHFSSPVHIVFNLDYFNIASFKRVLFLIYYAKELQEKKISVTIHWIYEENDEDYKEIGEDFAYITKIPFIFTPVKDKNNFNVNKYLSRSCPSPTFP